MSIMHCVVDCVLWQWGDPACPLLAMATPSLTVVAIHTWPKHNAIMLYIHIQMYI